MYSHCNNAIRYPPAAKVRAHSCEEGSQSFFCGRLCGSNGLIGCANRGGSDGPGGSREIEPHAPEYGGGSVGYTKHTAMKGGGAVFVGKSAYSWSSHDEYGSFDLGEEIRDRATGSTSGDPAQSKIRRLSTVEMRRICGAFQGSHRVQVRFNPSVETIGVQPYSEVYGVHPRDFYFYVDAGIVRMRLLNGISGGPSALKDRWPTSRGDLEAAAKGERQCTWAYRHTDGRMYMHP